MWFLVFRFWCFLMSETTWGSWNNGLFVRSWLFRWGMVGLFVGFGRLGADLELPNSLKFQKEKVHKDFGKADTVTRWWFQIFFLFTPIWGGFQF